MRIFIYYIMPWPRRETSTRMAVWHSVLGIGPRHLLKMQMLQFQFHITDQILCSEYQPERLYKICKICMKGFVGEPSQIMFQFMVCFDSYYYYLVVYDPILRTLHIQF